MVHRGCGGASEGTFYLQGTQPTKSIQMGGSLLGGHVQSAEHLAESEWGGVVDPQLAQIEVSLYLWKEE